MSQGIHPRVWSAFVLIFLLGAAALPQAAFAGTSPAADRCARHAFDRAQNMKLLLR